MMKIGGLNPSRMYVQSESREELALFAGKAGDVSHQSEGVCARFGGPVANDPTCAAIPKCVCEKSGGVR